MKTMLKSLLVSGVMFISLSPFVFAKTPTVITYGIGVDRNSKLVKDTLNHFKNYDVKSMTFFKDDTVMVEFNIPSNTKELPLTEEMKQAKIIFNNIKEHKIQGSTQKEWFEHVYPDRGYEIPFSTLKNGQYFIGKLNKLEYHHAENGVAYYRYGEWLPGYDPNKIQSFGKIPDMKN